MIKIFLKTTAPSSTRGAREKSGQLKDNKTMATKRTRARAVTVLVAEPAGFGERALFCDRFRGFGC